MNSTDMKLLKRLCLANGVSGYEDEVRSVLADEIKPYCDEAYIDALGNLIALKKGREKSDRKVMLCAHMDEVGFAVTWINDDGTLLFDGVGMSDVILPSKRVLIGKDRISGVISSRPIHLVKDKNKCAAAEELCIDIGAADRNDAEKYVCAGDFAAFDSDFCEFGDGYVKAKALDDRIGCAVMCDLIKSADFGCDVYFAFTVGEELGGVGALAAANEISPDVCVILEGTTASDIAETPEKDKVCILGNGVVSPFMDGGTMYDRELYTGIRSLAAELRIPCQTKSKVAGGTDASKIRPGGSGIRVCALSLPCRYIHTPSSVAKKSDMDSMKSLAFALTEKLTAGELL